MAIWKGEEHEVARGPASVGRAMKHRRLSVRQNTLQMSLLTCLCLPTVLTCPVGGHREVKDCYSDLLSCRVLIFQAAGAAPDKCLVSIIYHIVLSLGNKDIWVGRCARG